MASVNRVILSGNLVKDPKLAYTQNETAKCDFTIANNAGWGQREKVNYVPVVVFGKSAEACAKYLQKGSKVVVDGRLDDNRWQDEDDEWHQKTSIIADNVEFVAKIKSNDEADDDAADDEDDEPKPKKSAKKSKPVTEDDDDFPF